MILSSAMNRYFLQLPYVGLEPNTLYGLLNKESVLGHYSMFSSD